MPDQTKAPAYIKISLAYAPSSGRQYYQEIEVPIGTTIYEALQFAGWLSSDISTNTDFAVFKIWCEQVKNEKAVNTKQWFIGIYANKKPLHYVLSDNDRIEIYRALKADPMNRRKNKAKNKVKKKVM